MIYFLFNWFVKITGYILQLFIFRIKVFYEDKAAQGRKIRGSAIVVSNHSSLFDFGVMLFVFWRRTLRCVVAELMYEKNFFMSLFLNAAGCIKVDRNNHDISFVEKCKKLLDKGGVIEVYPESRLPTEDDVGLMEFKPSTVYLALESGAPIIPVYNSGKYFGKDPIHVIIGKPLYLRDMYDDNLSQKENVEKLNEFLRGKIIELGKELERQEKEG